MDFKGKVDRNSVSNLELGVKDEETKTMCTVLGIAKQWRIKDRLTLGDKMGAERWEALSKVIDKGKVDFFRGSKSAGRASAANNQQVAVLWHATDGQFMVVDYDDGGTIAKKSEGATGLEKLLAYKSGRNCQLM